jgi:hypothetical protein
MKPSLRAIGAIGLVTAAASFGAASAHASAPAITVSHTDTVASHASGGITLSPTGGQKTPIVSMSLPQGSYVLSASGDVVNFGPSDFTRCDIMVKGIEVGANSTIVGDPSQSGSVGSASLLSPVLVTGGVSVASPGATATLYCWHDNSNGSAPYFDVAGSMWAHRSSSLGTGSF